MRLSTTHGDFKKGKYCNAEARGIFRISFETKQK
jgi:hypothetical protein